MMQKDKQHSYDVTTEDPPTVLACPRLSYLVVPYALPLSVQRFVLSMLNEFSSTWQ